MKWIGAILFILTTTWVGFEWSQSLTRRPKQIRQLKNALQILEAEILYSQLPLRDAFLTISNQIPDPTKSFFLQLAEEMTTNNNDFGSIWKNSVDSYISKSSLNQTEKEILIQFGQTLGQHDFTQQQKHIQLTLHHLERELQEAIDNHYKYSNMAKTLGFLCGIFIVLLLI
ncbi:stage III sporulation protein SpoIIIAB [Ornithinibacillus halophilus]|uniref:Stage III sporulation protein AB n=1 Tax=Ornithinibacillus halophilus TaxID=930117 RepID=A0A1M5CZ10_9BACI|nr:stage III sporulation protein SpoIIIAB [Ornithinibacillus halophilus]SHF59969.1 stage III sporulation protein AB [Ornithinibacillus halophilus]